MKLTNGYLAKPAVSLIVCAFIISGCSSSGDSGSSDSGSSDSQSMQEEELVVPGSVDTSDETVDTIDAMENEQVPSDAEESVEEVSNPAESGETAMQTPDLETPEDLNVVPDPMVQIKTQVNFEITVPMYQSSDALQLRLTWGDIQASAGWVGGELWSLTLDFPSDTEQLLTIVFSDRNGDIELASYEQTYRTGFNDAETLQISADQFDTDRWDSDGDGISNFDELLAGEDPLVINSVLLDIRDSWGNEERVLYLVERDSGAFETEIPDERPYFEDEEVIVPPPENWNDDNSWGERTRTTVNIDSEGNGTYNYYFFDQHVFGDATTTTWEGTRSRSDGSNRWSGSKQMYNFSAGCYLHYVRFDTQTVKTDEGVVTQESDQSHLRDCAGRAPQITYSLTGVELDDSGLCEATSGTITVQRTYAGTNTASKAPEDDYWNVKRVDPEGLFIEEYLVPSIDLKFFCPFEEL